MSSSPPPLVRAEKRNAFTVLMESAKRLALKDAHSSASAADVAVPTTVVAASATTPVGEHPVFPVPPTSRNGLNVYIQRPADFVASGEVLAYDDTWSLIVDKFPKSSVHLLLLPRDRVRTQLHPFEALCAEYSTVSTPEATRAFYNEMKAILPTAVGIAAVRLERIHGRKFTAADIKTGIHSTPSMANLHIHVIALDHVSDSLARKSHYNSFTTSFFVPFADLEHLSIDKDIRLQRGPSYCTSLLHNDLVCWRCGKNFANRFADLKRHLEIELRNWLASKPPITPPLPES
ncbi:uncharacterized protein V1518DRAFT_417465 [Limtongia smithiae]|uniref:uncharacterized protein n=1 Tax=Limtongia smithiae TaxID=1125753 RepID=UPI0034CF33F9